MFRLAPTKQFLVFGMLCLSVFSLSVFSLNAASSSPSGVKPSSSTPLESPTKKEKTEPLPKYKPNERPKLPPMTKPFGMPGVIGLENGKWEGTDYLGYLSNNVGINVEVLKGDNVPKIFDNSTLEGYIANIFSKEDIIPRAEGIEGPPLPFLHLLVIIYPVGKDRYVIFANGRLFEQIQVIRKDFIPAGYWQGITWENQDITLSNGQELNAKLKELAEKIGDAFAKRYRQYNLNKEGLPGAQEAPVAPPAPS